ncbi:sigma 54-interacting transcriptional regulator [Archangium sp.]|jgi:two-component system nitrogen regulation response regulator GlnG|uniref:sigma 54-interacting transcriptional regulator n=1 Tax=Archangium sp. TaxID=1872627 RepID=UPI002ED94EB6
MNDGQTDDLATLSTTPRPSVGEQSPRAVPALTIISHPDIQRVGERLLLGALLTGGEVHLSRNAPAFVRPDGAPGTPLADRGLSRTKPIIFAPGPEGRVRLRVDEGGTWVVAGEPVLGTREFGPEALSAGVPLELAERVVLLLHLMEPDSSAPFQDSLGMVGQGTGTRLVRKHIEQVADLQVPVLIRGETGTGKELVAQAIHARSKRRGERFVSVNLGAIPKDLAAAELFGANKGAYTGALGREGFFRAAQGGTLFLDEVGEAPPEVQVMLLRVLETGEMYPVGGSTPITTNVRLVAATDANLEDQIRDGRFKAPLLHRLEGYAIRLPPLRARREDIGLLFFHFAREELEALGEGWRLTSTDPAAEPWLPAPLAARLVRYSWPGNIRQLRNLTRQLVIASRGQPRLRIDPQLERELGSASALPPPAAYAVRVPEAPEPKAVPRRKPSDVSEQELLAALRANSWDLKPAADQLGIPRTSIYDLIERSKSIRTAGDLSVEEITRCFQECQGDLDAMVRRLEVSKQALRRRIKELGLDS